jgi:hypothetical protein
VEKVVMNDKNEKQQKCCAKRVLNLKSLTFFCDERERERERERDCDEIEIQLDQVESWAVLNRYDSSAAKE